jgi:hypothetical protein
MMCIFNDTLRVVLFAATQLLVSGDKVHFITVGPLSVISCREVVQGAFVGLYIGPRFAIQ